PWDVDFVHPLSYNAIVDYVKHWVDGRYNWIDSLFVTSPSFDQAEGLITSGTTVTLTVPPGATNYYTLDGSDPRASQGGIAASATRYTGPFTVTSNVWIVARARMANSGVATAKPFQNTWSPPANRSYYTALPGLRITVIMY